MIHFLFIPTNQFPLDRLYVFLIEAFCSTSIKKIGCICVKFMLREYWSDVYGFLHALLHACKYYSDWGQPVAVSMSTHFVYYSLIICSYAFITFQTNTFSFPLLIKISRNSKQKVCYTSKTKKKTIEFEWNEFDNCAILCWTWTWILLVMLFWF